MPPIDAHLLELENEKFDVDMRVWSSLNDGILPLGKLKKRPYLSKFKKFIMGILEHEKVNLYIYIYYASIRF